MTRLVLDGATYFDAEDALFYSVNIRLHRYALYDAAGSGWQLLCTAIDAWLPRTADAAVAGKLVARASGTALLPLMYFTLIRLGVRGSLAVVVTLFFSGAFAPWWYSLQPDKYVPQLLLIALALGLVMTRERPPTPTFLIGLGLLYFLAVICHTDSGLICFSIFPLLYRTLRERGFWAALGQGVLCASVMFAVLAVYFSVLLFVVVRPSSVAQAIVWLQSYLSAPGEERNWGHWNPSAPLLALTGIGRAVFSTEFLFAFPGFATRMHAWFPAKILVDDEWFASHLPAWLMNVGLVLFPAAILAVVAVLLAGLCAFGDLLRRPNPRIVHAVASALCYLVPAFIFFCWWEPTNNEFWIAPWYGLALVIGLLLSGAAWERSFVLFVGTCAGILILFNGLLGVWPRLNPANDYWLVRQSALVRMLQPEDLVIENGFLASDYLEFLGAPRVFRVDFFAEKNNGIGKQLDLELKQRPVAGSIYVTDLVTDAAAQYEMEASDVHLRNVAAFFADLPAPAQWLSAGGHKVAQYKGANLLWRSNP
ncbi:hypothetical protein [Bradyrhizobium sp. CCBAU 11434]|uniref:hypothetical protein n=1 Tax=Bradyrhizobium sp. CCBAU 11434 TaxID=1630885 RepID=UPI002305FCB8|nr:hypothetical protein [Bradyrhizobium sp. CCBAU 11434]